MLDLQQLKTAVEELDEERVLGMMHEFIKGNPSTDEAQAVVETCQEGMQRVGDLFERGQYFVGDLILAGELLADIMDMTKPILWNAKSKEKIGSIVLGTVHGDLHDIGKNIFKHMAETAGFEVHDIGIDLPPQVFVDKVRELKPDIVGMSGMLVMSLDSMKETVESLKNAHLRKDVRVIIGGTPVTAEACSQIGADAFTTNAVKGLKIVKEWMKTS